MATSFTTTNGRTDVPVDENLPSVRSRINWGPILAGSVVALALYFVLTVLGTAVILTLLTQTDTSSVSNPSLGVAAAIWSAATFAVIRAVASVPCAARTRVVWVGRSTVQSNTTRSTYWCRIGSLAAVQNGLRSSTSDEPGTADCRRYGPDATQSSSYCAPVSLAFGTGVVVGRAATKGNSGCGAANVNTIV